MIYVVATLTVKPETRAEFIAGARMVFVEQWENAEALIPHRGAEHMKTFGRIAVKCFSAPPKIEIITPEKVDVR